MAKQLVNPVERHLEKAVLGAAALVLLYAIAFYLVTTPNSIELGSDKVTPTTIDAKVAQKASEVLERMRSANPKVEVPDPLIDDFVANLAPVEGKPLPGAVALGVDVPMFDVASITGKAQLAKVVPIPKPIYVKGRSTFEMTVGGQSKLVPVDWVTISVPIDMKGQADLFKKAYGATRTAVYLGPPEVQRRTQRPDGTWSEEDWQTIEPWPSSPVPRLPRLEVTEQGNTAFVEKSELQALEKYIKELTEPPTQRGIFRPLMGTPMNGDEWRIPELVSYREVLLMDDEIMRPDEPPAAVPEDLYGLGGATTAKTGSAPKTPEQQLADDLAAAQKMLEQAKRDLSVDDATNAFNKAFDVKQAKEASPALKQRAEKFMKEADQAIRDIQRDLVTGGARGPKPAVKEEKRLTRLPMQQLWVHDAAVGSLESGKTYQYRIRIRVLNHLAGSPEKLSNPKDAEVVLLTSDWSEPTDPFTIEPSSYFFLTGDDRGKQDIRVEFYRWFYGVWVKSNSFKVGIGDRLADKQRREAPAIDNPDEVDRPEIEFDGGAFVLDIDFDRPLRERKAGSGPKGVRLGPPAPSTVAVLVDGNGGLFERVVATDKSHPIKRELEQRLWKPPKASK